MYGLYANNLERFILTDKDLWPLMHSARLLSSKISTSVIHFNVDGIDNNNCIQWTLTDASVARQDHQVPKLYLSNSPLEHHTVILDGPDLETLKEEQKFFLFVLSAIKAAWLTDALLNSSGQKYFLKLLDSDEDVSSVIDDTDISGGFLFAIDKALYTATSVNFAMLSIHNIFNHPLCKRPSTLALYKTTFFKQLNELSI